MVAGELLKIPEAVLRKVVRLESCTSPTVFFSGYTGGYFSASPLFFYAVPSFPASSADIAHHPHKPSAMVNFKASYFICNFLLYRIINTFKDNLIILFSINQFFENSK